MPEQQQQATQPPAGPQGRDPKSNQVATTVKIIIAVVAVIALAIFLMWSFEEIKVRNEYNRIVSELMDEGEHQQAVTALKQLHGDVGPEMQDRINSDLASCYVALSRDMEVNLQQQKEYLNEAYALDPTALEADERMIIGQ